MGEFEIHSLKLAQRMNFKFPQSAKTPIASLCPNASPEAVQLMEDMMLYDPKKRPSCDKSLQYPYFQIGLNIPMAKGEARPPTWAEGAGGGYVNQGGNNAAAANAPYPTANPNMQKMQVQQQQYNQQGFSNVPTQQNYQAQQKPGGIVHPYNQQQAKVGMMQQGQYGSNQGGAQQYRY